uniref:Protein krueppel n=1 Tax=Glossina pallidipes TaxID=7398 RepID=A0A1A9Z509_GLOPL
MATSIAKKIDRGCRACIKAALSYQPLHQVIHTDISSKTYGELLKELLQVDYISSTEESLPQKICGKCATKLKKMYIFILEARKRHEELMQNIGGITIQNCLQEIPIDMPQLNKTQIKTDPEIIETQHCLLELVDVQIKTEPGDAEMQFSVSKNRNGEADTQLKADLNHNNGSKKEQQVVSDCNYRLDSISNDGSDVCSLAEDVVKEDLKLPQASLAVRCDICDKVYDNAVALKIHKTYTHMPEEQKMPCALCSYKSSRPSAIKVHLKNMHGPETVEKYFRPRRVLKGSLCCTQCPKRYSRKDHLQKHFKKVHLAVENSVKKSNRKPKQRSDQIYLCTFCGQSFAENGTLSKHIRIHTGDKPFKCNFCEKCFRNSGNLKYHLTTHSDEKPHTCSECGKSFKRKDKLRSHMLVHSELRPYKCSECGKTFKYSCVLKTHMQVHNNQIQLSLRNSLNIHCAKNEHLQQ